MVDLDLLVFRDLSHLSLATRSNWYTDLSLSKFRCMFRGSNRRNYAGADDPTVRGKVTA